MDRRGASTAGPRDPALRRRRSIVVALITVGLAACGGHRGEVEASPEPDPPTSSPPAASPEAEEADAALAAADAPAPAPAREEGPPGEAPTYPRPADWPDELPWIDTVRPDYTQVERSPAGDLRLNATVKSLPIAELARPWREALAARGMVEREPCAIDEAAATFACTLGGERRLAILGIRPGGAPGSEYSLLTLHLLPLDHRPLAALPGRCEAPPERRRGIRVETSGIDQEGEFHREARAWSVATHASVDLDGDGIGEVLVPDATKGRCPWEIPHDVYVMRGACGHRVGTIVGPVAGDTPIAPFVAGLRELRTEATWADYSPAKAGADDRRAAKAGDGDREARMIPTHHQRSRTYRFDGQKLRLVADHDQPGICHHCGVSDCYPE